MELKDAISYINHGDCILFVGSGFSWGATNRENSQIPTGWKLATELYSLCEESSEDGNLTDASELYIEKFGETEMVNFLKKKFTVSEITSSHKYMTSLPWKRIYTTNYDNIIEIGYKKNGKNIYPKVLSDSLSSSGDKRKICVHLNGYIDGLSEEKLTKELKLTTDSYDDTDFVNSEWIDLFNTDLQTADAIFFVGFSMKSDLDIERVVSFNPEVKGKSFFIIDVSASRPEQRKLSNFGSVHTIGVDCFVEQIKSVPVTPIQLTKKMRCFKKVENKDLPLAIEDRDVSDLLIYGKIDVQKVALSLINPSKKYYIRRDTIDDIINHIEDGEKRILIHSDLGNGKSMLLAGLGIELMRNKYNVYVHNGCNYNINSEVEQICTPVDDHTIIIADNYTQQPELIKALCRFGKDCAIILAERSAINDTASETLFRDLGDFIEINLNTLSDNEVKALSELLDNFGFWRDKAASNPYAKQEYIAHKCNRSLRNVLMDLLNSPHVFDKFKKIINVIRDKNGYYEALLLMLLGKRFNLRIDLEQVSSILGRSNINNSAFRRNSTITEFVNFDNGEFRVRSSLLAELILSNLSDTQTIVDLLIHIFKALDSHRFDTNNKQILKTLLSYSNLQKILNKKDSAYEHNIYRFFEEVKKLNFCKKNPHFWLQYAILVLSSRDYERAENYFNTAYSFINSRDADTFVIDNHFARYILENECESGTLETCMEAFRRAHDILIDPIHKTKVRFYPYRVAQNYYPFFNKFYRDLSTKDRKFFLDSCRGILARAEKYSPTADNGAARRDTKKAIVLLKQILNEAGEIK